MNLIFLVALAVVPPSSGFYNPLYHSMFRNDLEKYWPDELQEERVKGFISRKILKASEFSTIRNAFPSDRQDSTTRMPMGPKAGCDDGKTNLQVDWDGDPVNYTCYDPGYQIPIQSDLHPLKECDHIPHGYKPKHFCMDKTIEYDTPYPTHANHRPVWAKYGEYVFVPPQRWSHNIEHGAVVMLYHPCADPLMVSQLKDIVTSCIRKHIITPSNLIPENRPLVLVTWGCRLRMNTVDYKAVTKYIKKHALNGPEGTSKDGHFSEQLLHAAEPPIGSNSKDKHLCPKRT